MYLLPAKTSYNGRGLGLVAPMMTNGGRIAYPIRYPVVPRPPIRTVTETPRATTTTTPAPVVTATTTGTPVPAGFPVNQFYVHTDGSVWEYNAGKWFNTGTPYSAPGAVAAPGTPAVDSAPISSSSAAAQPVNVTVSPSGDSGYKTVLDWLTQQTLISSVPNWVVAAGVGLLGYKMASSSKGGR